MIIIYFTFRISRNFKPSEPQFPWEFRIFDVKVILGGFFSFRGLWWVKGRVGLHIGLSEGVHMKDFLVSGPLSPVWDQGEHSHALLSGPSLPQFYSFKNSFDFNASLRNLYWLLSRYKVRLHSFLKVFFNSFSPFPNIFFVFIFDFFYSIFFSFYFSCIFCLFEVSYVKGLLA